MLDGNDHHAAMIIVVSGHRDHLQTHDTKATDTEQNTPILASNFKLCIYYAHTPCDMSTTCSLDF